jgi:hypothetical protein
MGPTTVRITLCEAGTPESTWKEEYTIALRKDQTITNWANELLDQFNARESNPAFKRVFVIGRRLPLKDEIKHDWKKWGLVTQKGGYDTYKCSYCQATGKRHGLGSYVTPDKGFTEFCKIK